ncbi:hypothetical protein F5884DRAFT_786887 [Xylogone sp. PMI_703]|nr:hypothetical protein F5884DRAFT_786887 [Xylogone sp. PMI_703]
MNMDDNKTYDWNSYCADAIFVETIWKQNYYGRPNEFKHLIRDGDITAANLLSAEVSTGKKLRLLARVGHSVYADADSSTDEVQNFARLLERFRAGCFESSRSPSTLQKSIESEEPPSCRCHRPSSTVGYESHRPTPEESDIWDSWSPENDGDDYDHEENDCSDGDDIDDGYSTEKADTEITESRAIEAENLKYDGTTSVTSYISRLQFLSRRFGEENVLGKLDTAMEGVAQAWFDSLSLQDKLDMSESLNDWIARLKTRFTPDITSLLLEADEIKHSFGGMSDVRSFIDKKESMYREVGESNEDVMVRRIFLSLDPSLSQSITLKSRDNTMEEFKKSVYAAEATARVRHSRSSGYGGW